MKTHPESVRVGTLKELEAKNCMVVRLDQAVAVFHNDGKVFAVETRCPHMGFPLHRVASLVRVPGLLGAPVVGYNIAPE